MRPVPGQGQGRTRFRNFVYEIVARYVVTRIEAKEVKMQAGKLFRTVSIERLVGLVLLTAMALVREPGVEIAAHRKLPGHGGERYRPLA